MGSFPSRQEEEADIAAAEEHFEYHEWYIEGRDRHRHRHRCHHHRRRHRRRRRRRRRIDNPIAPKTLVGSTCMCTSFSSWGFCSTLPSCNTAAPPVRRRVVRDAKQQSIYCTHREGRLSGRGEAESQSRCEVEQDNTAAVTRTRESWGPHTYTSMCIAHRPLRSLATRRHLTKRGG